MIQIRTTGEIYRDGVMVGRIEPPELAQQMALEEVKIQLPPIVLAAVVDKVDMTIVFASDQLFPHCCPMCSKARVGIEEGKIHVARFECGTVMRAAADSLKGGSVVESCQ